MSWCDLYFLKFVNPTVFDKNQCSVLLYFSQCHVNKVVVAHKRRLKTHLFMLIFFPLESDQWLKYCIKFWNATKCKSSKARKHRAFRTKTFSTGARAGRFHPNLSICFFHSVLCFATKIFFLRIPAVLSAECVPALNKLRGLKTFRILNSVFWLSV